MGKNPVIHLTEKANTMNHGNNRATAMDSMEHVIHKEVPSMNEVSIEETPRANPDNGDSTSESRQSIHKNVFKKPNRVWAPVIKIWTPAGMASMPHWGKAIRIKTARTWWPAVRCTTWWSSCSQKRNKDDLEKECSSIRNTEVAYKDMVVQHNQPTDASTNEKRPGECVGLSGMDRAMVKNNHSWIKMVESIENKQTERIRKD